MAVVATGMVTGVGLTSPSSCAAIRCAVDRFQETRFIDEGGEWIVGSEVPLTPPSRGREKILRLTVTVVEECLASIPNVLRRQVPLLLCLAEPTRPGRFDGLDDSLIADIEQQLGVTFHANSAVIASGRVGGADAIVQASQLVQRGAPFCLVAGADTFLVAATLAAYQSKRRILTSKNSNGFIPGEAGAALLLAPAQTHDGYQLRCLGAGLGHEQATIESEEPLRADGLADAFRAALIDADCGFESIDYRITDANGEQYAFKEAALGLQRTMRILKPEFDIWHAADCIGEVGAAAVPCALAIAHTAAIKGYAPGPGVLAHFGNDAGERAALVLRYAR